MKIDKAKLNEFLIEKDPKLRLNKKKAITQYKKHIAKEWIIDKLKGFGLILLMILLVAIWGSLVFFLYPLLSGEILESTMEVDLYWWGLQLQQNWTYIFVILLFFLLVGSLALLVLIVIPYFISKIWDMFIKAIKSEAEILYIEYEEGQKQEIIEYIEYLLEVEEENKKIIEYLNLIDETEKDLD